MSARLASEIDLGILGRDERAMLPHDAYRESEEAWLSFALGLALGARIRMERMKPGAPDYLAEEARRRTALTAAMQHLNNLRQRYGAHTVDIPADLADALEREGL